MRSAFRRALFLAGLIPLACVSALAFEPAKAPSPNYNRLGVDRLTIQGGGSTGDVSGMSVAPSPTAPDGTLAKRLHTPTFGGTVTAPSLALTAPGSTGDVSAMSVLAPGGNTALPLANWFTRRIDVKSFGAFFDGARHPLSGRFGTLAAAQAVFPFVTALTEEADGVALQAALNHCATLRGGVVELPAGTGWTSRPIESRASQCNVAGPALNTEQLVFSANGIDNRFTTRLAAVDGFSGTVLRISPPEDSTKGQNITGAGAKGLLIDCRAQPGCTGYVQKSTSFFETNIAVYEPREATVAAAAATAPGNAILTVASTAGLTGLEYGASITHPSIPRGAVVKSWTPTTITLNTKTGASFTGSISGTKLTVSELAFGAIQAGAKLSGPGIAAGTSVVKRLGKTVDGVGTYQVSTSQTVASGTITTGVASGEMIGVAGEAARFDTAQTFGTNTLSWGDISVQGLNSGGRAPILLVNGAAPATGSGQGYGNPAHVTFDRVVCYTYRADCTVVGNADHVTFEVFNAFLIDPSLPEPKALIALGADLPPGTDNGPSYSNRWKYFSADAPIVIRGKEIYAYPSVNNEFDWLDSGNGTPLPTMGRDTLGYAANDNGRPVARDGGTVGVLAQLPDGTATRGGNRGPYANDLQKVRGLPGQIASGQLATIGGGGVNTASGGYATVPGGYNNSAQGRQSVATGMSAYALGVGWRCHSGGSADPATYAQTCDVPLIATINNLTTPIRLTGDKLPATSGGENGNCVNIPDNTAYSLDIQLTALNRSDPSLRYSWREPNAMLYRQTGAASTAYTPSGQASATGTNAWATPGTVSVTAAADTSVGCLNLAFVPPAGNSGYIAVSATVRLNWIQ